MKEIYGWVPWFHSLAQQIADGGKPLLIELAKTVQWNEDPSKSPPLLNYGEENVDPFSFFNYLAGLSYRAGNRARIYPSINRIAGTRGLPPLDRGDAFIFPASPSVAALFNNRGRGRPDLLWSLFRSAVSGVESVDEDDFDGALEISGVKIAKLTQVLFLINPKEFLPFDNTGVFSLDGSSFDKPKNVRWSRYQEELRRVRDVFPECWPYEINLFAYLQHKREITTNNQRCYQVSTNIDENGDDCWEEFRNNNWVRTGETWSQDGLGRTQAR